MVSSLLIFAVVILSLVLASVLLWRRHPDVCSIRDWETKKHEIDLRTFEALVDLNDERCLRGCLSPRQFHYFQRRRLRLALRSLQLLEENASMIMSLAQHARSKGDPVLCAKADEVVAVAFQLRVKLPLVRLYLFAKWLLPAWTASLPSFEPRYRELLNGMIQFQRLGQEALN
jgi:hypothetical protein